VALPALAQGNASDYPPACTESKVSASNRDDAHSLYVTAKRFLDESAYDKAISLLKDAYTLNCSVHDFLPVIATAYERKGDRKEAVRALEEYLARVPSGPDISKDDLQSREKVERRIKNLKDLMVVPTPSATVPPSATAAPTGVPPAAPTVAPTPPAVPKPVPAPTAAPSARPAAPAPAPTTTTGGRSAIPLVVTGIGAGIAGAGAAFYAVGSGQYADAEKDCPTHKDCTNDAVNRGEQGRTFMQVGVGGFIVGGAALVGGLVWYFVQPSRPARAQAHGEPRSAASGVYVTPVVTPNFAGGSAGFSF
jgi:hypothetical protein